MKLPAEVVSSMIPWAAFVNGTEMAAPIRKIRMIMAV